MAEEWINGTKFSPAELSTLYGIPREEVDSFRETVRIYERGACIIREGDTDKTLFLLRSGAVAVSKQINQHDRENIAVIKAVNFFGEMSLINDAARSATVEALSEKVLVYAVDRPNVNLILNNPRWGEMLLSRLSKNLDHTNKQLAATLLILLELKQDRDEVQKDLDHAQDERDSLVLEMARVLAMLSEFQQIIQNEAVVGSRGWVYLQTLNRLTDLLAQTYLPEVAQNAQSPNRERLRTCLAELGKKEPKNTYRAMIEQLRQLSL